MGDLWVFWPRDVSQKKTKSALIRPIRQLRVCTSRWGRLGATDFLNDSDCRRRLRDDVRVASHTVIRTRNGRTARTHADSSVHERRVAWFYSEALLLNATLYPLKSTKTQEIKMS